MGVAEIVARNILVEGRQILRGATGRGWCGLVYAETDKGHCGGEALIQHAPSDGDFYSSYPLSASSRLRQPYKQEGNVAICTFKQAQASGS